jgi:hypothetical protein
MVIDSVVNDVKATLDLDDPEQEREIWLPLKTKMIASLDKNLNQHLRSLMGSGGALSSSTSSLEIKGKDIATKGAGKTNARLVAWEEWKTTNSNPKKVKNPDGGAEMGAWEYWNKHVWKKMTDTEKDKYTGKASSTNESSKTSSTTSSTTSTTESTKTRSAFQLFQSVHQLLYTKADKFYDPDTNGTVTGWAITQKIWTKVIKVKADLLKPYDAMKDLLKSGEEEYNDEMLKRLPHIDMKMIQKSGWTYDQIKLID